MNELIKNIIEVLNNPNIIKEQKYFIGEYMLYDNLVTSIEQFNELGKGIIKLNYEYMLTANDCELMVYVRVFDVDNANKICVLYKMTK